MSHQSENNDHCAEVCKATIIHEERISEAYAHQLSDNEVSSLSRFFSALSDPTRIRILRALFITEMCVCDLCQLLSMQQSAVSHQLKTLRMSDLVRARKDGKVVYYSLSDSHIGDILTLCLEHLKEEKK